ALGKLRQRHAVVARRHERDQKQQPPDAFCRVRLLAPRDFAWRFLLHAYFSVARWAASRTRPRSAAGSTTRSRPAAASTRATTYAGLPQSNAIRAAPVGNSLRSAPAPKSSRKRCAHSGAVSSTTRAAAST